MKISQDILLTNQYEGDGQVFPVQLIKHDIGGMTRRTPCKLKFVNHQIKWGISHRPIT